MHFLNFTPGILTLAFYGKIFRATMLMHSRTIFQLSTYNHTRIPTACKMPRVSEKRCGGRNGRGRGRAALGGGPGRRADPGARYVGWEEYRQSSRSALVSSYRGSPG